MKTIEIEELLQKSGALRSGHFRLSSGLHSPAYVQCALLLEHPATAARVGRALAERIAPMSPRRIVAPALGGLIIGFTVAQALDLPLIFTERKEGVMTLRRGFSLGEATRTVIVEDVVTTGKSTRETAEVIRSEGGEVAGFAAILNRSGHGNPFDGPFAFLQEMNLETWPESECPLCDGGVPLDAPGSRYSGR